MQSHFEKSRLILRIVVKLWQVVRDILVIVSVDPWQSFVIEILVSLHSLYNGGKQSLYENLAEGILQ